MISKSLCEIEEEGLPTYCAFDIQLCALETPMDALDR